MSTTTCYIDVTAYHEAGHAVMCLVHRWPLRHIHISASQPGVGVTHYRQPVLAPPREQLLHPGNIKVLWQQYLDLQETYARIHLAGPLAEAKMLKKPMRADGATSDFGKTLRILKELDDCHAAMQKHVEIPTDYRVDFYDRMQQQTINILKRPQIWNAVELLAIDLIIWNNLEGREAAGTMQEILNAAPNQTCLSL